MWIQNILITLSDMTVNEIYIRTIEDLESAVNGLGFLPFFENSLTGFSIEEHVAPGVWFTGTDGPWEWKGPVINELCCAYGKFFEKKAAYISAEWFPDFANYRRDGYDFDARFEDGLVYRGDKVLYDLIDSNAPVLSKHLKRLGNYRKGGNKGFDTIVNRLQAQGYVIINDFRYMVDRNGNEYGWGVAEYSTPEHFMGKRFTDRVYERTPEESYERIFEHFRKMIPEADENKIRRFLR